MDYWPVGVVNVLDNFIILISMIMSQDENPDFLDSVAIGSSVGDVTWLKSNSYRYQMILTRVILNLVLVSSS